MQAYRFLLIQLAVVNLVNGQQHVQSRPRAGRQDDPTAMMASMGDHHNSQAESNSNVAYPSPLHEHSDWQVNLDRRQAINLGWSLDGAKNEALFTLKINTSRTKFSQGSDMFALGFSDYGSIESSDFCLLWFDLAHLARMRDAITDSLGRLSVLEESASHCKLVEIGGAANDLLVMRFTRPLDTCQENYYSIDNGTTHLIWFKMEGPVVDVNGINLSELQQQFRGTKSGAFESGLTRVQLAATKVAHTKNNNTESNPSSRSSLDVRMENYAIPARETTYWCKLFKLPHRFERRKFHITKYEAVVGEGNEQIVHHMELFNCVYESPEQARDLGDLYERQGGWSGECGAKERPPATDICRRVILAWAMGAKPLEYPEQVGQSIGGPQYSPYVVLEVHYNNVQSSQGLLDSSGLRFHFTHKLRPFDAGIMEVGLEYTDKNSIPPNLIAPLAGHCVSECTRAAMSSLRGPVSSPADHEQTSMARSASRGHHSKGNNHLGRRHERTETENDADEDSAAYLRANSDGHNGGDKQDGIYIFAAQMHTHLAGVATWTEQIREGRLLRELQRDNHYSPHFQEIRLLPEPVHLAAGDALIHYCLYDTRKRANITLGGFSTSDEMCVTYLHYYPRIELEVCKSSIDSRALDEYFLQLARQEGQMGDLLNLSSSSLSSAPAELIEQELGEKSAGQKYQSIEWSKRRSRELLELYATGPLSVQCNRSNGQRFPGFWNGVTPTKVFWPNGQQMAGDRRASLGVVDGNDDDPPGRRLAGGNPQWGPQMVQFRGPPSESRLARRSDLAAKCPLAGRPHERRPQI